MLRSIQHHPVALIAWVVLLASVVWVPITRADGLIQSFTTSHVLSDGSVVQIVGGAQDSVDLASQSSAVKTYGVVVDASNPPSPNHADVAVSGHFNVLVSDQNGPIATGDYLIVSGVDGIAMKDDGSEPITIGRALQPFSGRQGLLEADINIGPNPLENQLQRYVPPFLRQASGVISNGRLLSPWRIYLASAFAVVTLAGVSIIIYAAVRNTLISIGRNPLARPDIVRALLMVLAVAFFVLVFGSGAVVLLLRL